MNAPVSAASLANPGSELTTMGFGNTQQFEFLQRAARMLIESTLVPAMYRHWVPESKKKDAPLIENVNALSNAVVALNMAARMRADVLMIMQNLHVIEGRPSWSSPFIIAMINTCGRFSTLRFRIEKLGQRDVTYAEGYWEDQPGGGPGKRKYRNVTVTIQEMSAVAYCKELATGETIESPMVDMEMAVKEGWYGRDGSKWKTMPELMLHYRTAAFFGRLYAPELLMGLQTAEELKDIGLLVQQEDGVYAAAADHSAGFGAATATAARPPQSKSAAAAAAAPRPDTTPAPTDAAHAQSPQGPIDQSTGEIEEAAESPTAASAAQASAPAAAPPAATGSPCSEGELKFLLKKAVAQPLVLQQALNAVGFHAIDDKSPEQVTEIVQNVKWNELEGLTTDQFKAAKAKL